MAVLVGLAPDISSLLAPTSSGCRSQSSYITHGRITEESFVLSAEVGGVLVADPVPGGRGVQVLAKQETARFLKAKLLLKLQGTHRRNRLEVFVKARRTHPQFARQALNPQRLVEVLAPFLENL